MNLRETTFRTTNPDIFKEQITVTMSQRLAQVTICPIVGMLAGATSVALVIGLMIEVQLLLPPTIAFSLQGMALIGAAILSSLGLSWLFDRLTKLVLPKRLYASGRQALQLVLIFGILTSLLETLLFWPGL